MPLTAEECRMILYLLKDYAPKANGLDRTVVEELLTKVEQHKYKLTA